MTAANPAAVAGATHLTTLLAERASGARIAAHLDALGAAERLEQMLAVRGGGVKRLYEAASFSPAMTLDELLPANETGTRIYEGRNSLALFSRFQKRFHRVASGQIVGYNHQTMGFVTGPGYFVAKAPDANGAHPGELVFDYTVHPDAQPEGFPPFKSNDGGLGAIVYGGMQDYIRRVARGVIVGKAYKGTVDRSAYFSLTFAG